MNKLTFPDLSQKVKDQLITYARSHKVERRLTLRAQIILDWMNGLTYKASSEKNGVTENVIGKWRKRFAGDGLAGLTDAPRSGKPARFTEADRKKVIHLACQRTESGTQRYSQPELPLRSGNPRRVTNTYKRNGTVNLMAALAVQTGEVTAREVDRNNSENFLKFLKYLDRKYRNVQIHIIMDNLSTHKNKQVTEWLTKKSKFHVHFTPTYASWLNQIKIWLNIMSRKILKDGV